MTESGRQIGLEQIGIGHVLRTCWLQVPLHQREYSWTNREVDDLFHDIAKALDDDAPEYFLGSIVTIPQSGGVLEVVDGQQRLATTAILLASIRDYLSGREQDSTIVDDIQNILSAVDRSAREHRSRLRLNVTDNDYFAQRVLRAESSAQITHSSHKMIDRAAKLAKKHVLSIVSAHDSANHGDVLNNWIDYLEHNAIVALLKVPSEINAYRMFETLNDRGLRTSQSDLVKNYLFGEAGERIMEAQQKWAGMRSVLESFEDSDITINYLRQMLVSLYGPVREGDVYDTVAGQYRRAQQAITFLTLLESGATDYAAILNPQHEKWNTYPPSIRESLAALSIVRVKQMRPLMLAVARKFDGNEAERAFRLMLSASVRLMIAGGARSAGRSGAIESALGKAAMNVSSGAITTTDQLRRALEDDIPKDPQFSSAFRSATVSRTDLARYYLRCLEMAAKDEADPCFVPNEDATVVNLEHILPRKPEGNWGQFTEEEAEASYRRLGNMVLLQARSNSDLRSAPYETKKAVYEGSPYVLTSQVAEADEWTVDTIDTRQKRLSELAVKTWPWAVT